MVGYACKFVYVQDVFCVLVCVCGSGKLNVMGTKCPLKDGNIQNLWPCGDIFSPHEENSCDVFWKSKNAVFCDG